MAVAPDARIRSLPGGVPGDERVDYAGPELIAQVDREVWKAQTVRERTRLSDRGGRATALLAVVLRV